MGAAICSRGGGPSHSPAGLTTKHFNRTRTGMTLTFNVDSLRPLPRSVTFICNSRSSRRPVGRSITTVAVGLVTLGLLASYGATKASADQGSGDRLGCGTYCQTAGGYGSAGGNVTLPPPAVSLVSTGTVTADADGYVPVTLTCHRTVQCRGVLRLFGTFLTVDPDTGNAIHPVVSGQSDLVVDAGATRTIGVPLSRPAGSSGASAIALLRSNGPTTLDLQIDAAAQDLNLGEDYRVPDNGLTSMSSDKLTVAAPR